MKKLSIIFFAFFLIGACAGQSSQQGASVEHGAKTALRGIAHLILSPVQIAAGLLEGIASVPYYLSTSINDINNGLIAAHAEITLDDTYDSAYGRRLSQVPENGDTKQTFRRMKHATTYFQKVLKAYGLQNADNYILASIDTAKKQDYVLFSVVYRPSKSISIIDKYDKKSVRTFGQSDRLFYEPFEKNKNGTPLDTVVDWAAFPLKEIQNQKAQATLITIAANSVLRKKRSPDYWEIERRWIAGEYEKITRASMNSVKEKMNVN